MWTVVTSDRDHPLISCSTSGAPYVLHMVNSYLVRITVSRVLMSLNSFRMSEFVVFPTKHR